MEPSANLSVNDVSDFFLRLTQTELPRLVAIFTPGFATHSDRQRLILFTLDTLIQSSQGVGFDNLANLFQSLRDHLPTVWPIPPEDRRLLITIISEIRRLAELMEVEEGLGVYTGSGDLAFQLNLALRGEFYQRCHLLNHHLETLLAADAQTDLPFIYEQAADTAATIWQLLECSGHTMCAPLILMAADLLHRAAIHKLLVAPVLLRQLQDGVSLVEQTCRASADGVPGPSDDDLNFHLKKIRDCLKAGGTCSEEEIDNAYALLQGIAPPLQETLTPHHLDELLAAKQQGLNQIQLQVDMERNPLVTERFLHWLPSHAKIITNRSILQQCSSAFLFLLVTSLTQQQLRQELQILDPGSQCIQLME